MAWGREAHMAHTKGRSDKIISELADLTGRSDAELRLVMGGVAAGVGVVVALRTLQGLVDLGATFSRHR